MPEQFPADSRRSLRSQSLDLLRFPLAVIVAAIHVIATRSYCVGNHIVRFDSMAGADSFYHFFDAFLRGQSVPIYFFISGYVFFLGIKLTIDTYGHKLQNRSKSLLIPYISWNILAIGVAAIAVLPQMSDIIPAAKTFHINLSLENVLQCFWNAHDGIFSDGTITTPGSDIYPQDYPLWFVRDLMIIVICTPMIYFCLKKTRWYAVGALAAIWFVLSPFKMGHFGQLLTGFFFFSWGAHTSFHGKDMITEFNKFFKTSVLLYCSISLLIWLLPDIPHVIVHLLKSINVVAGMVMAYGLAARLIQSRRVKVSKFLAVASFFVYAGHALFVAYINIFLFRLFRPEHFYGVALIYLATLVLTISLLLLIFKLLGRYLPSIQKILAGKTYR